MVKLHLRCSKCDQFGKGVDIVVGHTDTPLCPVMAILDYIKLRQDHPGAFFRMKDGTPTTKGWFIGKLRGILSSIGLPQGDYAGHSFRIGAATSAAIAGVEDSMIQALGRWQSAAFLQYGNSPQQYRLLLPDRTDCHSVCPSLHLYLCALITIIGFGGV